MKVTVIEIGKARKCSEMEKPENFDSYKGQSILPREMINYGKHIQSLPILSCPPEWPIGKTFEEGKDFELEYQFHYIMGNTNWEPCSKGFHDDYDGPKRIVLVPI